jgi:phenylpropionate dioxygenase-like ring-hydroxylating dioxygenase large terminal subunit
MAGALKANGRWARRYPELGTAPLPIDPCVSAEYFELERERVFKRAWLNLGRLDEIPRPGDFFVRDLAICKTSILVVRGGDRQVRAFHNMCSHRGNKLVWDHTGNCRSITCKFHGWTYDPAGRLVGVPDEGNFFDLNKEDNGLTAVAVDTWEGFIFVNLAPRPPQSLREFLGEVIDQLKGYPFDKFSFGYGYKGELKCNWKISVDSQQEGYHAVHLHRRTLGDICAIPDNPFMHALDIKFFGPHRMLSLPGNMAHSPTAVEGLAHKFGWSIKREDLGFLDRDNLPKGINPTRDPNWLFDIYLIFPNFWLAPFNGAFQTHHFWPVAHDRMYQEIKMYVVPPRTAGQSFSVEFAKCVNRDIWLEDFSTLENTQEMLGSGAKKAFILQDEEVCIRHFYKVLDDWIRTAARPPGTTARRRQR